MTQKPFFRFLSPALLLPLLGVAECGGGEDIDADADGWTTAQGDCDDGSWQVHPGAAEQCDEVDNDCDGQADEPTTWYLDADGDGFGTTAQQAQACQAPPGHTAVAGDCDDADADAHPGAVERCDLRDNDCDGAADEDFPTRYFPDLDGDGLGGSAQVACVPTDGYVASRGDCDDRSPSVFPGASDVAGDGVDQDCGGSDGAQPHVGLSAGSRASIQAALDAASSGETVWIGPGTYAEHDLTFRGRDLKLVSTHFAARTIVEAGGLGRVLRLASGEGPEALVDGLTLRGGFVRANGGGVYIADASPTMRGCVVTANRAEAPEESGNEGGDGGGMYVTRSSADLREIELSGNSGLQHRFDTCDPYCDYSEYIGGHGGGMAIVNASPTVSHLRLVGNSVDDDSPEHIQASRGGGLYVRGGELELTESLFEGNSAVVGGGAAVEESTLILRDTGFLSNVAYERRSNSTSGAGGGLYANASSVVLDAVQFLSNRSNAGGGLYAYDATLTVRGSSFIENTVENVGGGLHLERPAPATITSSLFLNNRAREGGAIRLSHADPVLRNVSLVGNVAEVGGGIAMDTGCVPKIVNSLLAFNTGLNLYNDPQYSCAPDVQYSSLYSAYGPNHNLLSLPATNVEEDPRFVAFSPDLDPNDDDLHLRPGSPLRNAGDPATWDPDGTRAELGMYGGMDADIAYYKDLDADGLYDGWEAHHGLSPGVQDGGADPDGDGLGNLQELEAGTAPDDPDTDGDGASDGVELGGGDPLDWYLRPAPGSGGADVTAVARVPEDFPTLEAALAAVRWRGEIDVGPGTYPGGIVIAGKAVTLRGRDGLEQTVLDGAGIQVLNTVWVDLTLSGFTLTGGAGQYGGGLYFTDGEANLSELRFAGNSAERGGGARIQRATVSLTRLSFEQNAASWNSGGLSLSDVAATGEHCLFRENTSRSCGALSILGASAADLQHFIFRDNTSTEFTGGALVISGESLDPAITLRHSLFERNSARDSGGALNIFFASVVLENVAVIDNDTGLDGGALYVDHADVYVRQSAFVGNTSSAGTGGIYVYGKGLHDFELEGSIVAYNSGYNLFSRTDIGGEIDTAPDITVSYSDLYNPGSAPQHNLPTLGATALVVEPGFLAYDADGLPADLHLAKGSPLVNAGSSASTDVDWTRSDPGIYGCSAGGAWDVDADGFPAWFWPGAFADVPAGVNASDYDRDDRDPAVH